MESPAGCAGTPRAAPAPHGCARASDHSACAPTPRARNTPPAPTGGAPQATHLAPPGDGSPLDPPPCHPPIYKEAQGGTISWGVCQAAAGLPPPFRCVLGGRGCALRARSKKARLPPRWRFAEVWQQPCCLLAPLRPKHGPQGPRRMHASAPAPAAARPSPQTPRAPAPAASAPAVRAAPRQHPNAHVHTRRFDSRSSACGMRALRGFSITPRPPGGGGAHPPPSRGAPSRRMPAAHGGRPFPPQKLWVAPGAVKGKACGRALRTRP